MNKLYAMTNARKFNDMRIHIDMNKLLSFIIKRNNA